MSNWWWRADYVETCNCARGCPCNFTMIPTHGGCHGVDAYRIREGDCDGVRLDGLNAALVFAWPGPIHHGHGRGVVHVDERASPAQRSALEKILTGEAGPGGPFEIFRSTFDDRPRVVASPATVERDGRRALPEGFIFQDGLIVNVDDGRVRGDGLEFDYRNCSAFIADVAYD